MKKLKDLVKGDKVIYSNISTRSVATVDRVTKTMIMTRFGNRYNRQTGVMVGSNNNIWSCESIHVPSEGEVAKLVRQNDVRKLVSKIRSFNINSLSWEDLVKVEEILRKSELSKGENKLAL